MIVFTSGDILSAKTDALVNTVNCVGVMGRGIALQFKNAFPVNFDEYAAACKQGDVQPGRMLVHKTGRIVPPYYIINFPTKRHWRGKSRIEDIEIGLESLADVIRVNDIRSIAIPPLGCGLGGLNWDDVRPRIVAALADLSHVAITVYEPTGAPEASKLVHSVKPPKMTAGRAALIELITRYLRGSLDPHISLLEVHKLMYFLQEAGEELRLRFNPGYYGPYAENLRHVMNAIEGHFVSGYADGGDDPTKELEVLPEAASEAERFLEDKPVTRANFARVSRLVEGYETAYGLELLATVHWLLKRDPSVTPEGLTDQVHHWSPRKQQFTPRQIRLAATTLSAQGWASAPRPQQA